MRQEILIGMAWREAFLASLAAQREVLGLRVVSAEEMEVKLRGPRWLIRRPAPAVRVWMVTAGVPSSPARRIMMDVYLEARGGSMPRGLLMNTEVYKGGKMLSGWNTMPRDLNGVDFNHAAHAQNLHESLKRHVF